MCSEEEILIILKNPTLKTEISQPPLKIMQKIIKIIKHYHQEVKTITKCNLRGVTIDPK